MSLTLKAQTPFTTLDEPEVDDHVPRREPRRRSARASSRSASSSARRSASRVEYESSLVDGPVGALIYVDTFAQDGTLEPGTTREFSVSVDLSDIDGVSDDRLRWSTPRGSISGARGTQVGVARHAARAPRADARGADRVRVVDRVRRPDRDRPAGTPRRRRRSRPRSRPTGGLAAAGRCARGRGRPRADGVVAVDLVVVPAVIDQLARMADGYERATASPCAADRARPATDARGAARRRCGDSVDDPDVHVVAAPFAAPLLPIAAPPAASRADLDRQQRLGEAIVAEHLGREPARATARPPQGAARRAEPAVARRSGRHDGARAGRHGRAAGPAQRLRAAARPPR